jgi:hypothetical protein
MDRLQAVGYRLKGERKVKRQNAKVKSGNSVLLFFVLSFILIGDLLGSPTSSLLSSLQPSAYSLFLLQ